MKRITIRARATFSILVLVAMAAAETGIVLYVQRESGLAFEEAARTEAIMFQEGALRGAMAEAHAAHQRFVVTGSPDDRQAYESGRSAYEESMEMLAPLLRDAQQRRRFERIQSLSTAWHSVSQQIVEQRARDERIENALSAERNRRFQALGAEMEAFARRAQVLSRSAIAVGRTHIDNATAALTAIPIATVVVLLALMATTEWTILRPLRGLVGTAKRLAGGDFTAPLPKATRDEIGTLVSAFSDMRSAVQARAQEAAAAHDLVRQAHGDLMAVVQAAPAGLIVFNADGSVKLQNKMAEYVMGNVAHDPAEREAHWQRFPIRDAHGRDLNFRELPLLRALQGEEVGAEELNVTRADGQKTDVLIGAVPLRDGSGQIVGAVAGLQDITRLRELDRMKDEFVAIVSHELRTPLTAIRGSLQLLLADEALPDPEHRGLLTVAASSCERLVRIVNDMLDLSKIEAGHLELRRASLSVATLVTQAAEGMRALADQGGVALRVAVPDTTPTINADADRLTQALVNLISNAVKFSPPGSTVTISARTTESAVAISIADEGPGIEPAQLPLLFRKFQQLDSAGTRRKGGTGLGLVITKALVEQHGGQVDVASTPGVGTTFTMTIPAVKAADAVEPERAVSTLSPEFVRTVMVIGSEEASRRRLAKALESTGFRPIESPTGPPALELALRELPDAVVVCVGADDGSGQATMEAFDNHEALSDTPLLVAMLDATVPTSTSAVEQHAADVVDRVSGMLEGRAPITVLVADDETPVRSMLRRMLEHYGFRVVEAGDGAQAIELAARTRLDAVLLDLHMPRVHGHDVIRALRKAQATADLPIIVLSGSHGERHSLYSLVLGANSFITKPAGSEALVREITRLVRRRREALV